MCKLLISVRNATEATLAKQNGADFIDLKDPENGALGALDLGETACVIAALNGTPMISATVGDLPMEQEAIDDAISRRLAFGIDYIKVGFFPASLQAFERCLQVIQHYTEQGHKIIVVLFADCTYPHALMTALKNADIAGVMLDTAYKNGKTLLDCCSGDQLASFFEEMRAGDRIIGLAGSLQLRDVSHLKQYKPDYLGFRGGVCDSGLRQAALNSERIRELSKVL